MIAHKTRMLWGIHFVTILVSTLVLLEAKLVIANTLEVIQLQADFLIQL